MKIVTCWQGFWVLNKNRIYKFDIIFGLLKGSPEEIVTEDASWGFLCMSDPVIKWLYYLSKATSKSIRKA